MYRGYVKLWRALLDKPVWKKSTSDQRSVLVAILLMANHESAEWEWQGKRFNVNPGEFITSLASLKELAGSSITTQNVRSALKRFEKLEFLTNKSTKTGRLITIINWEVYQGVFEEANKEANKEVTKTQQRGNKEVTPNKNDKNYKNDKNKHIEYPEWLNIENWNEYKEHRISLKSKMTSLAEKKAINKLEKFIKAGYSQEEIIDETIAQGWRGLFKPKTKPEVTCTKQPECSKCGTIASNIKQGKECPFCGKLV